MLGVEETWLIAKLGLGEISPMATGNQATQNIQISWLEMGMMPGKEAPLMEDNSTMATLVREYIRISGRELVYHTLGVEVTWRKDKSTMAALVREHIKISRVEMLVYKFVSRKETSKTLGVEEMLMEGRSTMATWNLVGRNYIRISWEELVYEFVSGEETSKTLGVEEMLMEGRSTMATWNLVGRNYIRISWGELVYEFVSEFVSGEETYQTLGVEVTWMKDKSTMATLVREHIRISRVEVLVYEVKSRAR
jgi:hypothetical protein